MFLHHRTGRSLRRFAKIRQLIRQFTPRKLNDTERYIREVHCGDPPMEREEKKEQKEQKELRTERKNKTRIIFKNPV